MEDARVREATTLLERLEAWTEAADKDRLEKALPKVEKVHNELRTQSMRVKLQKALGAIVGEEACGRLRLLAADSLGRLNDPDHAWKQLKPHLPDVGDTAVHPVPLRAVQAVGALAPDAAIATLSKLLEKAKDANASRHAAQALGKYGWSKRREAVLKTLAEYLRRVRPSQRGGGKGRGGGEAARERYAMLRDTMVVAMQELTGRKELDSDEKWLEAWKTHKKKPAALFTFER